MDQAASVISTPSSALYITFFPFLNAEPILLPVLRTTPRAVFVCANSLVVSDKAVGESTYLCTIHLSLTQAMPLGAKTRYNLRVVETLDAGWEMLSDMVSLGQRTRQRRQFGRF